MDLMSAIAIISLLLLFSSGSNSSTALHLYVHERFVSLGNSGETFCGSCDLDGDCTAIRSFVVQGECFPLSGTDASYEFLEHDDEAGVVCLRTFNNKECNGSSDNDNDSNCDVQWLLNQCTVGEELSGQEAVQVTRFPDHCIESQNGPVDDYTVPMVQVLTFSTLRDCENNSGDQMNFEEGGDNFDLMLLLADKELCTLVPVTVTGGRGQTGSAMVHCADNENDNSQQLVQTSFSDRECSQQNDDALLSPKETRINSSCTLEDSGGETVYRKANCGSITLYCKPLYDAHFGTQVQGLASHPPSSTDNNNNNNDDDTQEMPSSGTMPANEDSQEDVDNMASSSSGSNALWYSISSTFAVSSNLRLLILVSLGFN